MIIVDQASMRVNAASVIIFAVACMALSGAQGPALRFSNQGYATFAKVSQTIQRSSAVSAHHIIS
jgi:hypothetical protein